MLRSLSELDLLGHLTYGDTSVSFKTILTTYTPDHIYKNNSLCLTISEQLNLVV
jgi:hypothetical protein